MTCSASQLSQAYMFSLVPLFFHNIRHSMDMIGSLRLGSTRMLSPFQSCKVHLSLGTDGHSQSRTYTGNNVSDASISSFYFDDRVLGPVLISVGPQRIMILLESTPDDIQAAARPLRHDVQRW